MNTKNYFTSTATLIISKLLHYVIFCRYLYIFCKTLQMGIGHRQPYYMKHICQDTARFIICNSLLIEYSIKIQLLSIIHNYQFAIKWRTTALHLLIYLTFCLLQPENRTVHTQSCIITFDQRMPCFTNQLMVDRDWQNGYQVEQLHPCNTFPYH